jgi:hypothetical protein
MPDAARNVLPQGGLPKVDAVLSILQPVREQGYGEDNEEQEEERRYRIHRV